MLAEFPQPDSLLYFNHAAVGPWPQRTRDAVVAFAEENLSRGAQHYPKWVEVETALRQQFVSLLNAASVDDIALVKNTSEALSMVAHGIDWQPGDNVVVPATEFPSNRIVWDSLQGYGVDVRWVDLTALDTPETSIIAQMDANTRLLSTSSVQYDTGLRLDLNTLGEACQQRHCLFCVDAIQSIGVLPFDVEAVHADFVMADGHKWMLGPEGLAVFYSRPAAREQLRLHEYGWHMVEELYEFDNCDWQTAHSARRFECGSPNMLAAHALHASLSLLLEVGMETVSRQVLANSRKLINEINNISSLELITNPAEHAHAGIVTFKINNHDLEDVFSRLTQQNVVCAKRGGGIRLSPHFYTPAEKLDKIIEILIQTVK